jgi:hypothetical protein
MDMSNVITEEHLFLKDFTGKSKKPPFNDFRLIELHDPETLENVSYFLPSDSTIPKGIFQLKQKVQATFGKQVMFGEAKLVLKSLNIVQK